MKKLAQIISIIFDPRVEVPLLLTFAVLTFYRGGIPVVFLGLLLFVDVVLPMVFYAHLRLAGEISHWDIKRRKERVPLYIFSTLAHLGGVGVALAFGQLGLAKVLGVFWFLALMFTLVTTFWRVSLHVGVNAALFVYLVVTTGGSYWVGVLVILVAWSRVKLGRHEIPQVLIGGLLGGLGVLGGMRVMGI